MEKILIFLVLRVVFMAFGDPLDYEPARCTTEHDNIRSYMIDACLCGPPRDKFQTLMSNASYEQLIPFGVWVKACMGYCLYPGSRCEPTKETTREIPIRIVSLYDKSGNRSDMEFCTTITISEPVRCGCNCTGLPCEGQTDPDDEANPDQPSLN